MSNSNTLVGDKFKTMLKRFLLKNSMMIKKNDEKISTWNFYQYPD